MHDLVQVRQKFKTSPLAMFPASETQSRTSLKLNQSNMTIHGMQTRLQHTKLNQTVLPVILGFKKLQHWKIKQAQVHQ